MWRIAEKDVAFFYSNNTDSMLGKWFSRRYRTWDIWWKSAWSNRNGLDKKSGSKCWILSEFHEQLKNVPMNAKSYAVSCFDTMGLSSDHYCKSIDEVYTKSLNSPKDNCYQYNPGQPELKKHSSHHKDWNAQLRSVTISVKCQQPTKVFFFFTELKEVKVMKWLVSGILLISSVPFTALREHHKS